jgi:hypothetical protein
MLLGGFWGIILPEVKIGLPFTVDVGLPEASKTGLEREEKLVGIGG